MAKLCAPGPDPYTYTGHTGIDFLRGPKYLGKPFYASGPGRVVRLSKNAAGGCWIVVRYDGTANDVGYAHMYNHNGCPRPGTRFNTGAQLGFVGALGTRVTGAHIHVEVLGLATPAAVWGIFTPSCYATGTSGPAGGINPGKEDDLGTIDNTEANYQTFAAFLQRAFFYDVRRNGFGPKWEFGPTVFEMLAAANNSAEIAKLAVGGGTIDVDALAKEIRAGLPEDIAKELGRRLSV